jgi:hypothetical protein
MTVSSGRYIETQRGRQHESAEAPVQRDINHTFCLPRSSSKPQLLYQNPKFGTFSLMTAAFAVPKSLRAGKMSCPLSALVHLQKKTKLSPECPPSLRPCRIRVRLLPDALGLPSIFHLSMLHIKRSTRRRDVSCWKLCPPTESLSTWRLVCLAGRRDKNSTFTSILLFLFHPSFHLLSTKSVP